MISLFRKKRKTSSISMASVYFAFCEIVFPSNRSFSTCFELYSDSEGFADLNLIPFWFWAFDSVAESIASVAVGAVLVELLS